MWFCAAVNAPDLHIFIAIKEEYRGKGIGKKLLTIQMQRFFMRN